MKRYAFGFGFLCLAVAVSASAQDRPGLEDVFLPGTLLQDRNGDAVTDYVDGWIALGGDPSPALVAAASDVAVRLGFETMAMDLPLTAKRGGMAIAVGAEAASSCSIAVDSLGPGEGLVAIASADGGPCVVIAGADDAGTRSAAAVFAGRLPRLWDPQGDGFQDVFAELREFLSSDGVEPGEVAVSRIVVAANGEGLSELALSIELATSEAVDRAETALGSLAEQTASDRALSYEAVRELALVLDAPSASAEVRMPRVPSEPAGGPIPGRPGAGEKRDLDLSNLYTPGGLLGDSDDNRIADRIDAVLSPAGSIDKTVDLAARLGLEATGISVPIVKLPQEVGEAAQEPTLVLIGEHPLLEDELAPPALDPGEGSIRVVPGAFENKGALIITGGDRAGLDRALEQVAERFPHVWERGKDRTTLDDVEMDLWRFVSGRSSSGQAATALYKLDRIASKLSEKEIRSARVLVSVEKPDEGFDALLRERAAALGAEALEVALDDRDVRNAAVLFEESFEVASEVDAFWRLFRSRVLPRVQQDRTVAIEARLSEPPEIRKRIAERARRELAEAGARAPEVTVLSAYKQGYSWLYDVVRPRLEAKSIENLTIRFARYAPPAEWQQQAMYTPLRWLHEAFPIDEILARELGVDVERIRFEMAPSDAPPYEVLATGPGGAEIYRGSFAPKFVLRPYIDRFRDYELVNVTTGWLTAKVGDDIVVDQRIATDPERFWDHFQESTLSRLYEHVMELHEGKPRGDGKDAPYFGELTVELTLSEPHYRLDLDQEIVSSIDALHEDIYFTTLMFFRILGRNSRGEELTYPGRVIPIVKPKADGKPGRATIRATGFATSRPAVVVEYEDIDGRKDDARLDVPKVEVERPRALGALVRAGEEGIERLDVRFKVDTEKDEREEFLKRARAEEVDERILSAEQVVAMFENLTELRSRGLYADALAYQGLNAIRVVSGWEHEIHPETELAVTLPPNGRPASFPDVNRYLASPYEYDGEEIVQWNTPIPPPEAYALLAKMATFAEATVYKMGESYLGREVWAMDLMPPIEASHFSHDKATTLKPTVIYSARQHANEVSSTSHVLKLAELLLTDPEHRKKLDRVNVVIHPITNPDGAQLAYDLYRETPDLILHAGYYASLGMDVTSDDEQPMPLYPEATVRPRLWSTWLPDIFLNPHGYPSHQLVQLFSEYTGLVRRGRVTERNWSMNKGWFMPGFDYLDDPRYPRHKEAAFRIRDYITEAINASPDVYAMNQRNYDRYERYGARFDDDVFKLPMVDDVLIHTTIKGSRAPSPGSRDRGYHPKVTIWSGSTEAPDETAHGDWLKLVATAGLQWDQAILQYLVDGNHEVERKGESFWGGVSLRLDRPRPPKEEEDAETEGGSVER